MVKSKGSMTSAMFAKNSEELFDSRSDEGLSYMEMDGNPELGFASVEDYERAIKSFTTTSVPWRHPEGEVQEKRTRALDVELERQNYNDEIRLGVSLSDDVLETYEVGATINQKGISSWSAKSYVADGYAIDAQSDFGGNAVVFVMQNGTRKGGDTHEMSIYPHEAEVTLSSKSSQVITKKRTENGIIYIYVEEV